MPTTSQPPRRSKGRAGASPKGGPLERVSLTLSLTGPRPESIERQAAEEGFAIEEKGRKVSISFTVSSADEALKKLRLLAFLVAPRV